MIKVNHDLPQCPVEIALQMIGDRWKSLIIRELVRARGKKLRFSQIKKGIDNISDKMLSKNLKCLESDRLISKDIFAEVPPKVEYSLTELGQTLTPVIRSLFDWGELYKNYIEKENGDE